MIYDSLEQISKYLGMSEHMDCAIRYLMQAQLSDLSAGRYEIDGDKVYMMIQEPKLRGAAEAKYEMHRRYADIQLCLSGGESIAYLPCEEVKAWEDYDEGGDFALSVDRPQGIDLPMRPGRFALFYPQDAHMPCLKSSEQATRKAVVKVLL